jgi:PAS domain S-box-containing protein
MYTVFVLIAGFLFGTRGGLIAGIVFCLTALGLVLLGWAGLLPPSRIHYTALSIWVLVAMCLEFIVIFQFMVNRRIRTALELAKRNEIALNESQQRYREVFESTSDNIFLFDVTTDGQFLCYRFNPASEEVVGLKSVEAVGWTFEQIFPSKVAEEVTAHFRRCAAQGSRIDFEETITGVHGKHYHFYTTLIPLKDAENRVYRIVGVGHNITGRKEAEAALRRSRDELEQRVVDRTTELEAANKELEAFSYSVSHDLRAPLRHIDGFVQILKATKYHSFDDEARQLMQSISESTQQMGRLIDDLLEFSRTTRVELKRGPVNFDDIIQNVLHEMEPDIKDRNIEWKIGKLPQTEGDPGLLRQVLYNLINNALKYTRTRALAKIEIGSLPSDNEVIIFVKDNGVGFDPRHAQKLFGVFQRLHLASEFEGTGIGLANVRRIISRHGGRTWAESKLDEGATFYFTCPKVG